MLNWFKNLFIKQSNNKEKNLKTIQKIAQDLVVGDDIFLSFKDPKKIFSPHPPSRWNLSEEENNRGSLKGTVTLILEESNNVTGIELSCICLGPGQNKWRSTTFFLDEIRNIELIKNTKE